MRTWQSKCAAWRKRANLRKNHRPGNGNTQACVLPRALLGFCTAPRNPLLKRHCGGDNKLVCCQRPHLFSQQLTAQSLVCSQIKHGKELLSQFRTIDCLVRRAAPRKTDNNFCHYIACLVACRSARCFSHRFGNDNTQVCVLTRAKLDLLRFYRATRCSNGIAVVATNSFVVKDRICSRNN